MKTFYKNALVLDCVLLVVYTLLSATVSIAASQVDPEDEAGPFKINATIMEINLNTNLIVIGEKNIYLRSSKNNGQKVWNTVFEDAKGKKISVDDLKYRDRVLVNGNKSLSGVMKADSVTLIKSAESTEQGKVNQEAGSTTQRSLPVYQEKGVWKN